MLKRTLDDYVAKGLVSAQRHPVHPLTIYNYTPKCSYERAWDDYTTACRGLVVDDDGVCQAMCVPKFFNYNEPEAAGVPWGREYLELEEKFDGSMILAFVYDGQYVFATRGSFTSPQAEKAAQLFYKSNAFLLPGITYVFEVLYPEDQKVVTYDKEELILLTRIDMQTGEEDRRESPVFRMPKRLAGLTFTKPDGIARAIADLTGVEGFVARFAGGCRVKFKTPWYVERHRYISRLSPRFIWEQLKEGKTKLLDQHVPEGRREWVTGVAVDLANKWTSVLWKGLDAAQNARGMSSLRKGQAKYIMKHYPEVSRIAFNFLDGKTEEAFESAWRKVKPCGVQ